MSAIYRPPDKTKEYWDRILDQLEESLSCIDAEIIVLGDLNHNYIFDANLYKNPIFQLEDLYDMKQLITEPTRCTDTTATLLDVIITSNPDMHLKSGVCKCSMSDHDLVFTVIDEPEHENKQEHVELTFRDTRKFMPEKFLSDIEAEITGKDLSWENWRDQFVSISDKYAPICEQRINVKKTLGRYRSC